MESYYQKIDFFYLTIMTEEITEKIRIEFLTLVKENKIGYYISLKTIYDWLGNPEFYTKYDTNKIVRDNFSRKYIKSTKIKLDKAEDETDLKSDFIMRKNDKNISYPWFSSTGFKIFCMIVDEKKSYYIHRYFIMVESDYYRVLSQTNKENVNELKKLNNNIEQLEKTNQKIGNKFKKEEEQHFILKCNIDKYRQIDDALKNRKDFDYYGDSEYRELQYFRELHCKKVPIFVVNPDYVNDIKKKSITKKEKIFEEFGFDMSSDEDEKEIKVISTKTKIIYDDRNNMLLKYEKLFDEYDIFDFDYEHNPLYFYIGTLNVIDKPKDNFKKITDLYFKDKKHLDDLKFIFDTNELYYDKFLYKTQHKSIYQTTFTKIKHIRDTLIQNRLRDVLNKKYPAID
jgi:hypothetical protein